MSKSKNKTLFIITVKNIIDITTNSSSELFIFSGKSLNVVKEMIKNIYPNYLREYAEIVHVSKASDEQLDTYLSRVKYKNSIFDYKRDKSSIRSCQNLAKSFNTTPENLFSNWEQSTQEYFYPNFSKEGFKLFRKLLKNEKETFLLFSKDDNPNWEYQEKLSKIGERYRLG